MKLMPFCLWASVLSIMPSVPVYGADDLSIKVGGRVQIDHTEASIDNVDVSKTELRRARLNVSGKVGDHVKYKFEVNKSSDKDLTIEDAYIQFLPEKLGFKVKAGQFKTHNSLDEATSSRFMSTLERAAFTDAFDFDRRVGVSIGRSGDKYTFDVGAFSTNLEEDGGTKEGHVFAARGTYLPIDLEETIVHFGASWRYRSKGDTATRLRYRQRPYTHVAPSRIVSTNRFAESDNFIGVEAALLHKQVWLAGEYGAITAKGEGNNPDGKFDGFYAEAGTFFGGKKTYKGGKFNRPKVNRSINDGGMGAISFVARYDRLDLGDTPYEGRLDTVVAGADWWPTKYSRLGVNYYYSDAESGSADQADGFVGRLQFDF